jgi:hypothetical protein
MLSGERSRYQNGGERQGIAKNGTNSHG